MSFHINCSFRNPLHPTPCHCFLWFPRDFILNNLSMIPFHILNYKLIDLIPNETVFEYHSTSIALLKTNWFSFHTNVSFDPRGISIEATCQWFLSLSLNRNQLMSMYSLIPNWIEVECHSLLIPNRTVLECHSTTIALLKTHCIPLHATVSFDSQVISI